MPRMKRTALTRLPDSPSPLFYYTNLTARERRFVDQYVTHLDAFRAAREAGYARHNAYADLLATEHVRCAIRERTQAVSQLAGITAADIRRELKQIFEVDATELGGNHWVPCRHCYGMNHQFQYTDAEMRYIEQAHAYGDTGWPLSCVTNEYGPDVYRHATAAYVAGKSGRTLDIKGGDGYTRNRDVNLDCPQCHGRGVNMTWVCDTRRISDGAKRLLRGIRVGDSKIEVLTIDRAHIRDMLARDLQVGVERKELVVTLPRTPDEFRKVIEKMPVTELEEFIANMVTLGEGEYHEVEPQSELPPPSRPRFTRGN